MGKEEDSRIVPFGSIMKGASPHSKTKKLQNSVWSSEKVLFPRSVIWIRVSPLWEAVFLLPKAVIFFISGKRNI